MHREAWLQSTEGRQGLAQHTVPSHITFVPSLYRPVLSLLLCLQVRQHRACRKPGLWSKCFLSSSGPRLSALILHHR